MKSVRVSNPSNSAPWRAQIAGGLHTAFIGLLLLIGPLSPTHGGAVETVDSEPSDGAKSELIKSMQERAKVIRSGTEIDFAHITWEVDEAHQQLAFDTLAKFAATSCSGAIFKSPEAASSSANASRAELSRLLGPAASEPIRWKILFFGEKVRFEKRVPDSIFKAVAARGLRYPEDPATDWIYTESTISEYRHDGNTLTVKHLSPKDAYPFPFYSLDLSLSRFNPTPEAIEATHLDSDGRAETLRWGSEKFEVSLEIEKQNLLGIKLTMKETAGPLRQETIFGGGWPTKRGQALPNSVLDVKHLVTKKAYLIDLYSFAQVSSEVRAKDVSLETKADTQVYDEE